MVQGASQQGSFTVERVPRQFKTARLDLGPFELSDAKRVVELAGDWDVARWTASIPHPYSIDSAQRWIAHQADQTKELVFAIRFDADLIGCISYSILSGEIGFWIGRAYSNQGFATEALVGLVQTLRACDFTNFWAATLPSNRASARVLSKAGFLPAGFFVVAGRLRYSGKRLLKYEF
jgi:RimJ/RimL family protein N-acetyltransferase